MSNDMNASFFKISRRQINVFANNVFENFTLSNLNTSLSKLLIVSFELKVKQELKFKLIELFDNSQATRFITKIEKMIISINISNTFQVFNRVT